jgi:hypothetical protein
MICIIVVLIIVKKFGRRGVQVKVIEKVHDNGWNSKRSLRKASSVGDFYTNKSKFREIYYRMFEQGKRFLLWNPDIGFSKNIIAIPSSESTKAYLPQALAYRP